MSTAFGPSGVMRSASLHRAGQLRGVSNAVRACRRNLGRFGAEPGHGIQGRRTFALCMLAPERLHYEGISNRDKKGEGKKVLVAGGAGYIGSHVCADLLLNGYEVVVLDNFMNSSPAAIRRVVRF